VLLDPVLDDLGTMPDVAQVGVNPLHQLVGAMAEARMLDLIVAARNLRRVTSPD